MDESIEAAHSQSLHLKHICHMLNFWNMLAISKFIEILQHVILLKLNDTTVYILSYISVRKTFYSELVSRLLASLKLIFFSTCTLQWNFEKPSPSNISPWIFIRLRYSSRNEHFMPVSWSLPSQDLVIGQL